MPSIDNRARTKRIKVVSKLGEDCCSSKNILVKVPVMAPWSCSLKTIKNFDIRVDILLPRAGITLGQIVQSVQDDILVPAGSFANISGITFNLLAWKQALAKIASEDCKIIPPSGLERTIQPTDVSRLDTDSNLIPQSSTTKLLGKPNLTERNWFMDCAVIVTR